jgi:hypothetical protein
MRHEFLRWPRTAYEIGTVIVRLLAKACCRGSAQNRSTVKKVVAGGIGRATARKFVSEGARVCLVDIEAEPQLLAPRRASRIRRSPCSIAS